MSPNIEMVLHFILYFLVEHYELILLSLAIVIVSLTSELTPSV